MGKSFTAASKEDNVYTPSSMIQQFIENEYFDFSKIVGEPACGNGAIVKVLKNKFTKVYYSDVAITNEFNTTSIDFLIDPIGIRNYIITNPPYSKLDQFIIKAKQIATEKFAFLCKITHLGGVDRFNSGIFRDPEYPLTKIYMFTRQANLKFCEAYPGLRDDGKYPAGMYYYCWLVWEKGKVNPDLFYPDFRWIDNNKYILRK